MKAGILICSLLLGAVVWGAVAAVPTTWSQEPPPPAADAAADPEGPEVLTRGPIHEAFAEPLTDPEPGILVPKKPPEDIEEVPPEYAPDLEGAIWIKGYWAWDDEREDFIWISGVHRVPPPGMRWMAGFWDEIEGKGWQWNRGFWIKADVEELSYRDAPPASLEEGPSSPSPGDDYFYVPGYWAYDTDYRWSPGYWAVYRPDCVWVPAHWVWTPGGYVFIPGYCDYSIARRGCLYAPVYFHSAYYTRPGYYYRPWCALNVGNLMIHFWVRPSYCHYYFGNYYGGYGGFGLTPWYQWSYHHHHHHYDPILSWSDVHYHRSGVNYRERLGGWHKHYERHENERPPRTWNEQVKLVSQTNITNITQVNKVKNVAVRQNFLAAKVDDMAQVEDAPVKLRKLDAKQQEAAKKSAKLMQEDIVQTREQRRKFERTVALPTGGKTGERAPSEAGQPGEKGAKGAKGGDAKGSGAKGAKGDRGSKGKTETTAAAGGGARGKLKLPQAKVKPIAAKVDMPSEPARATGPTKAGGGELPKAKGTKGGGKAKVDTGDVSPKVTDPPARTKGKGREPGGAEKSPKVETPKITLPENKPPMPATKGSTPREPRDATPRELPRPDRSPKLEGSGKSKVEASAPRIETPSLGPAETLPAPRSDVPKNKPPRTDSGGGASAAPRLTRPAASEQPRVDAPRVERSLPQPRVETPRVEPRVTTPRVEVPSSQPRVSAPRSEISRPQPRVERSQPRSQSRGTSRKRD
jgi:hypothetical protein